jgi:hypothetical protein
MNSKDFKFSLLVLFLAGAIGCQKTEESNDLNYVSYDKTIITAFQYKSSQIQKKLLGKRSKSIEMLISDSILVENKDQLIMVMSLYDCSTCIITGVSFLHKHETKFRPNSNKILSGILFEERLFSEVRDNYIQDEEAWIMKELGYFPTPALITI